MIVKISYKLLIPRKNGKETFTEVLNGSKYMAVKNETEAREKFQKMMEDQSKYNGEGTTGYITEISSREAEEALVWLIDQHKDSHWY